MNIYVHNKVAAIKKAQEAGKNGAVLRFKDGTQHVVLLNGQQVRRIPKDRSISGKARRRQEKAARREASEMELRIDEVRE